MRSMLMQIDAPSGQDVRGKPKSADGRVWDVAAVPNNGDERLLPVGADLTSRPWARWLNGKRT